MSSFLKRFVQFFNFKNKTQIFQVDFDLFLSEDAKMGEKIQLSEKIEQALHRMKCPHLLQAHQIEGLDYPYIFPVVQWLLTRVLEARAQFGDQLRQYSQYACQSKHGYSFAKAEGEGDGGLQSLCPELSGRLQDSYGVSRQFRRKGRVTSSSKSEVIHKRLNWTLMEFGHRVLLRDVGGGDSTKSSPEKGKRRGTVAQKQEQIKSIDVDQINEDFNRLQVDGDDDGTLSGAKAAQLVGQRLNEIQQAASEYSTDANQSVLASYMQQKSELQKQIGLASQERDRYAAKMSEVESELGEVEGEREKGEKVVTKLKGELSGMKDLLSDPEVGPALKEIFPLVEEKHKLSKSREEFKAKCEEEREQLKRDAAEATAAAERASQLDQSDQDLVAEFGAVEKQTQKLQQDVSKASRAALFLRRTLDDIPNSYELTQYQKRFAELYDLVQANLQETRNHFRTYNVLSDTKEYLAKEAKLMGSIYSSFMAASKSVSGQRAFLEQLEGISKGVDKTVEKYTGKFDVQKDDLDTATEMYQEQLGLQRMYLKTIKDLQASMNKYESLTMTAARVK